MAAPGKLFDRRGGHTRLNRNLAPWSIGLREPRRLERLLDVHPVIDIIRRKLRMRQRLIGSSHDSESDVQIAALHERRNDGVEGPLASREHVGAGGIERESGAAV